MKVLIGAAAAALLLATPALAQTPQAAGACGSFAAAPSLIDGANANRDQMTSKNEEVTAWATARQQQEATCQQEINTMRTQLEAMVSAFNTSGQERVTVVQNWNAEIAEFGGRSGASTGRQRGGVITRPDN
jgi:septal ring factor EnvC (AmiA/AmiB activator)